MPTMIAIVCAISTVLQGIEAATTLTEKWNRQEGTMSSNAKKRLLALAFIASSIATAYVGFWAFNYHPKPDIQEKIVTVEKQIPFLQRRVGPRQQKDSRVRQHRGVITLSHMENLRNNDC